MFSVRVNGRTRHLNRQALATLNRGRANRGLRPLNGRRLAASAGRGRSAGT